MNLLLFPQHIALGGCLKPVTKHGRCRNAWPSFLQAVHSLGNTVTWKDKGLTRGPGFPSKPDAPCVVRWKHGWWVRHGWQEREISKWCWWRNIIQMYNTNCDRVLGRISHYYSMLVKNSHETSRARIGSDISTGPLTHPCLPTAAHLPRKKNEATQLLQTPGVGVFLALASKYLICHLLACFLICK